MVYEVDQYSTYIRRPGAKTHTFVVFVVFERSESVLMYPMYLPSSTPESVATRAA